VSRFFLARLLVARALPAAHPAKRATALSALTLLARFARALQQNRLLTRLSTLERLRQAGEIPERLMKNHRDRECK